MTLLVPQVGLHHIFKTDADVSNPAVPSMTTRCKKPILQDGAPRQLMTHLRHDYLKRSANDGWINASFIKLKVKFSS